MNRFSNHPRVVFEACLKCGDAVNPRHQRHGWMHAKCEQDSAIAAETLVALVEAQRGKVTA